MPDGQDELEALEHERVVFANDPDSGLRAIVAVHSTVLGPALGGLRVRRYGSTAEALADVAALGRTMTLKASAAGLELGGGKAVIIDDGRPADRDDRLRAFGALVESLGGAYITAEDIGTSVRDMDVVAERTRYVVGRGREHGGGGDPSLVTAETVYRALRCGLAVAAASDRVEGRTVGVIGLGKVGDALARRLTAEGAQVVGFDTDVVRLARWRDETGGEAAPSAEAILARPLDVLAPCATGGLIDLVTADVLQCGVIAGAANNPLTGPDVARRLGQRGILYVPDFLANCGGLVNAASEWEGYDPDAVQRRVDRAMEGLRVVLESAALSGRLPLDVAVARARERLAAAA
jgi:valine dehydrogenase (NAD+)